MPRKSTNVAVSTIGIDLGKNTFHLVDLDSAGDQQDHLFFVPEAYRRHFLNR